MNVVSLQTAIGEIKDRLYQVIVEGIISLGYTYSVIPNVIGLV